MTYLNFGRTSQIRNGDLYHVKALTDGLIFIRYLFGFTGESLTAGVIGSGAERDAPEEIKEYLDQLVGP